VRLFKEGVKVIPEVMIPLVGHVNELRAQREIVDRVAKEVMAETGMKIKYLAGTMIELPRAAITADQVAQVAQAFSNRYKTDLLQYLKQGYGPFPQAGLSDEEYQTVLKIVNGLPKYK
jgi:phosphoenolpyruvate synthase/pyruvate phosphate dikinase